MPRRRLGLILGLAALCAAFVAAGARADNPPTLGNVLITPKPPQVLLGPWWGQCPDSGSCDAPTLRLWLPSFGSGYSKVEAGRATSCGAGCYDVPNGEYITIRAVPNDGFTFTGWGGKCETIGRVTGCRFHMWNNYTAAATFAPLPSQSGSTTGDSNSSPVTIGVRFVVSVTGKGSVAVQGSISDSSSVCRYSLCSLSRPKKQSVQLTAIQTAGKPFLGWGGRCRGTQLTCTFLNDFGRDGAPRITAAFGS
jgi:Divergent InlB B-repeat domain